VEVSRYSNVFIVVDALDECSEMNETRSRLLDALRSLTGMVQILVTSRGIPSINIEQDFPGTRRLDIRATDDDMRRYIETRTPRSYPLELKAQVVDKVIRNASGM
jgi:hypothetical protein